MTHGHLKSHPSFHHLDGRDLPKHDHHNLALFTDLYELTMLQAYVEVGMQEQATFSLHVIMNPAAVFIKAATCERSGSTRRLGVSPPPPRGAEGASGI